MATAAENYYNNVRNANRQVWDGINALQALQREWNALDYGNTLPQGDDLGGDHAGVTRAELGAVVFDTANAMETEVLNAGHATNMAKLL